FGQNCGNACFYLLSQSRYGARQFVGSAGRFPEPERDARRLAPGVFDADLARVDAQDLPRRIAELENISREAFDSEVFVDGPDESLTGLEHDAIISVVGN